MADDDDDYLSDKFLTVAEPQKPKTYSDKRKDALRESLLRNEQNRIKSRRQLELESREEGLSKSLFERAEDDKASGRGPENKALSMMMKMGFKPGQGLGVPTDLEGGATVRDATPQHDDIPPQGTSIVQPEKHKRQLVNPLPLNEWSGTCNSALFVASASASFSSPGLYSLLSLWLLIRFAHVDDREERYRPRKARPIADGARTAGKGRQGHRRGRQAVLQGPVPP